MAELLYILLGSSYRFIDIIRQHVNGCVRRFLHSELQLFAGGGIGKVTYRDDWYNQHNGEDQHHLPLQRTGCEVVDNVFYFCIHSNDSPLVA
ncbi:hypothetical protein D3C75_725730 [compost metagenome]